MNKDELIDPKARVSVPVTHLPIFRTTIALQRGTADNLLFRTWGGLGDQICAEPTLRYALKMFKGCKISLSSERPELFEHLNFHEVFDERNVRPKYEKYLVFETITPPDESNMVWQFFSHMLVNCVDFPSLCAYRAQLPVVDREIFLQGKAPKITDAGRDYAFVHPGRHWPSKTFPKDWWDETLNVMKFLGLTPVLIGANTDDNRGTVDVDVAGCVDLRNQLSVSETIWLLQRAKVLLTNDSAPLHMAASTDPYSPRETGHCFVNYIATCKHPDLITHFRKGEWQYRETNLGLDGAWNHTNQCPNQQGDVTIENVDEDLLRSWLPEPEDVAEKVRHDFDHFWTP